jgi:hypothetical protein
MTVEVGEVDRMVVSESGQSTIRPVRSSGEDEKESEVDDDVVHRSSDRMLLLFMVAMKTEKSESIGRQNRRFAVGAIFVGGGRASLSRIQVSMTAQIPVYIVLSHSK